MRLEMGTFPVTDIAFGGTTRYDAGRLTVDREAVQAAVRQDPRIAEAQLEIARPRESVRIWPVRDVIEPRIKVEGPGVCYPGICGRDIATVSLVYKVRGRDMTGRQTQTWIRFPDVGWKVIHAHVSMIAEQPIH